MNCSKCNSAVGLNDCEKVVYISIKDGKLVCSRCKVTCTETLRRMSLSDDAQDSTMRSETGSTLMAGPVAKEASKSEQEVLATVSEAHYQSMHVKAMPIAADSPKQITVSSQSDKSAWKSEHEEDKLGGSIKQGAGVSQSTEGLRYVFMVDDLKDLGGSSATGPIYKTVSQVASGSNKSEHGYLAAAPEEKDKLELIELKLNKMKMDLGMGIENDKNVASKDPKCSQVNEEAKKADGELEELQCVPCLKRIATLPLDGSMTECKGYEDLEIKVDHACQDTEANTSLSMPRLEPASVPVRCPSCGLLEFPGDFSKHIFRDHDIREYIKIGVSTQFDLNIPINCTRENECIKMFLIQLKPTDTTSCIKTLLPVFLNARQMSCSDLVGLSPVKQNNDGQVYNFLFWPSMFLPNGQSFNFVLGIWNQNSPQVYLQALVSGKVHRMGNIINARNADQIDGNGCILRLSQGQMKACVKDDMLKFQVEIF